MRLQLAAPFVEIIAFCSRMVGELAAAENSYGIPGIAPQSRIGVSSAVGRTCILGICWWTDDFENAVNRAAAQLGIGDIMIIEQHAPGPDSGLPKDPNCRFFRL